MRFSDATELLSAVVGSGVALSVFDTKRRCGGMSYYIRPIRKTRADTSTMFACPSIVGLLNMLLGSGSKRRHLEAQLYGGAENRSIKGCIRNIGRHNIRVAMEILRLKKVRIVGTGAGGSYGRKVVFNTSTGEVIIAKVGAIRDSDWYPAMIPHTQ